MSRSTSFSRGSSSRGLHGSTPPAGGSGTAPNSGYVHCPLRAPNPLSVSMARRGRPPYVANVRLRGASARRLDGMARRPLLARRAWRPFMVIGRGAGDGRPRRPVCAYPHTRSSRPPPRRRDPTPGRRPLALAAPGVNLADPGSVVVICALLCVLFVLMNRQPARGPRGSRTGAVGRPCRSGVEAAVRSTPRVDAVVSERTHRGDCRRSLWSSSWR